MPTQKVDLRDLSKGLRLVKAAHDRRDQAWMLFNTLFTGTEFHRVEAEGSIVRHKHFRGVLNYLTITPESKNLSLWFTRLAQEENNLWKSIHPEPIVVRFDDFDIHVGDGKIKFLDEERGNYLILHTDGDELDVSLIDRWN